MWQVSWNFLEFFVFVIFLVTFFEDSETHCSDPDSDTNKPTIAFLYAYSSPILSSWICYQLNAISIIPPIFWAMK